MLGAALFSHETLTSLSVTDHPTSLDIGESMTQRKRRTLVAPDMNLSLDRSEGSMLSDDLLETPDDLDINVDDIETPDETDSLEFINNGNELEWEGQEGACTQLCFMMFRSPGVLGSGGPHRPGPIRDSKPLYPGLKLQRMNVGKAGTEDTLTP